MTISTEDLLNKIYVFQVWYLPGVAERFGIGRFQYAHYDEG